MPVVAVQKEVNLLWQGANRCKYRQHPREQRYYCSIVQNTIKLTHSVPKRSHSVNNPSSSSSKASMSFSSISNPQRSGFALIRSWFVLLAAVPRAKSQETIFHQTRSTSKCPRSAEMWKKSRSNFKDMKEEDSYSHSEYSTSAVFVLLIPRISPKVL